MRKRIGCAALALMMLCGMVGCKRSGDEEKQPVYTLPPATAGWEAPDGDQPIRQAADYLLYLPGRNELQLIPQSVQIREASLGETAEELTRRLLETVNESRTSAERELTMNRERAVEISGGICTVNLSASARQLNDSDYYRLCLALATTLCETGEITGVNVLTMDQSVGLDATGSLPMGTLTGHAGENLPVLWEQTEGKRVPQGENAGTTPLNTLATIYYPLEEGRGIACETRMMNFEGQTPGQFSTALLDAMSEIVSRRSGRGDLPKLTDILLHEAVASELEEGGKLITLSFRETLREAAAEWNTDLACLAAAITWTLTTFVPGTAAVCIRMGDAPVTELGSSRFPMEMMLGGLARRNAFSAFLTGSVTVFFERDGHLIRCEKPVDRQTTDSPRAQMAALMQGPGQKEKREGMTSTLPETVQEDDLLGIAAEGEILLVNLSEHFREEIREWGEEKESLLCYSMVNTLCVNTGMKRVCFFFEGEQAEEIAGGVYWAGIFFYNPEI